MEIIRVCGFLALVVSAFGMNCPPILSKGVQCDKDGSHMDCGKDVPVETRATCRPLYVSPNADAFCGPDGWTIPDFSFCGKAKGNTNYRPFGATIYQVVKRDFNSRICSGTLIGEGYVVTIAHCILNHLDEKLENEVIRVGVGPPTNETIYEVTNVSFSSNDTDGDIRSDALAVITLRDFILNEDTLPACLPTCGQLDAIALRNGSTGEVFPRGRESAEMLKVKVTENCTHFNDFCAGDSSDSLQKKCPEEIGTGITIPMGEDAHFIYGVLSSSSNPSCNNFRTFKRVFPFVGWVKATLDQEPTLQNVEVTTPQTELLPEKSEETVISRTENPYDDFTETSIPPPINLTSAFEISATSTELPIPVIDKLVEIPKKKQMKMINLTISHKYIKEETLLSSLRFAKKLVRLDIQNSTLPFPFEAYEELPSIRVYTLTDVHFLEPPNTFGGYFPFYKDNSSVLSKLPILFDEINIDDGSKRFLVKGNDGLLLVSGFQDMKAKNILSNISISWKQIMLEKVNYDGSHLPPTLEYLYLSDLPVEIGKLSQSLKSLTELKSLGLHDLGNEALDVQELPNNSLRKLRIDRMRLMCSAETDTDLRIFPNLTLFYWGIDVKLDGKIIKNFGEIFPHVKTVAYFDKDDVTIVETLLGLKDLELLLLRVQDIQTTEGKSILNRINFNATTPIGSHTIHVCMERKKGETTFSSRHLNTPETFFEAKNKFDEEIDILQCHGIDW